MTRRKVLYRIGVTISAVGGCLCWIVRRALPRRVVRAERLEKYPGAVVPVGDIRIRSKWSG